MFDAKTIRFAEALRPDLDFSVLGTEEFAILKIVENATGGGVIPVYDADIVNGIASFDGVTRSKPLVSLLLNIPVTQSGSGTPSPTNIRDFVGVDTVRINMVDFNQIADNNRPPTNRNGLTITGGLDGFTIDGTATAQTNAAGWFKLDNSYEEYMAITEHKVFVSLQLLSGKITKAEGQTRSLYFGLGGNTGNASIDGISNIIVNPNIISSSTSTLTVVNGTKFENAKIGLNCIDITEAFGSRIADSLYNMEQQTQGAGVALFKQIFYKDYYAYNVGGSWVSVASVNGDSYPDYAEIQIGQTVYSAILDVLTGKLYLTHEIKTIDENSGVQRADNGILFVNSFFEIDEDTESINCNVYQRGDNRGTVAQVSSYNPDLSFCCKLGTNTTRLMIKDTRFATLEDYKTWLSTNPVKIAVKLATPIEIDITPTIINTLIGENVIFADVANVTECKYTRK